jgi:hypothetical protein
MAAAVMPRLGLKERRDHAMELLKTAFASEKGSV